MQTGCYKMERSLAYFIINWNVIYFINNYGTLIESHGCQIEWYIFDDLE